MSIFFFLLAAVHLIFVIFEWKTSTADINKKLYDLYWTKEGDVIFFSNEKTKVTRQYSFFIAIYLLCMVYGVVIHDFVFVILNVFQVLFSFIDICQSTHRLNMLCAGEALDERENKKKPWNMMLNGIYIIWLIKLILE